MQSKASQVMFRGHLWKGRLSHLKSCLEGVCDAFSSHLPTRISHSIVPYYGSRSQLEDLPSKSRLRLMMIPPPKLSKVNSDFFHRKRNFCKRF